MLILFVSESNAYMEKDYTEVFCKVMQGDMKVVLPDLTRPDCVTDQYAIEADFAHKQYEAIGQALFYANELNKNPGILLIMEKDSDTKHLNRLLRTINNVLLLEINSDKIVKGKTIKVWTINSILEVKEVR